VLGDAAVGVGTSRRRCVFIRGGSSPAQKLGARADIRKALRAELQILTMVVHGRWQSPGGRGLLSANHDRPEQHSPPSCRSAGGVLAAQRHPDHRGDGDSCLAMYCRWVW